MAAISVARDPQTRKAESWGYRPYLDGLRAIAVYLVVAFHAGADRLSGGFIGVDVFFVLSGYLVTTILLRDVGESGSINFGRFYSRRFRRLLPAAAVALIGTAVVFAAIGTPAELLDAEGAMKAASLYYANWFFIGQATDYFAGDVLSSPFLHFWSLSVEEQFYVAWPLILGGLHRVTRRAGAHQRRIVSVMVCSGMVASLVGALLLARTNLNHAYYGTETRAYQLLAGALLALAPGIIGRLRRISPDTGAGRLLRLLPTIALASLAVAATSLLPVGAITRGVVATVATVALLATLEVSTGGVRALLSVAPLTFLGRISYGTYLWHWIVILVLRRALDMSPLTTAAFAAVVATGLASLSYQLLEMPVRQSQWLDRRRRLVIVAGLATSAMIGVVVAPRALRPAAASTTAAASAETPDGAAPVPAGLDWRAAADDHGQFPQCRGSAPATCLRVRGGKLKVMLIGDSNARMYLSLFETLARKRGFTLSALLSPGCTWPIGIQRTGEAGGVVGGLTASCQNSQREWYGFIVPALDPDIVVLVHRGIDDPMSPTPIQDEDVGPLQMDTRKFRTAFDARARATVRQLRDDGRKVVILEPAPVTTTTHDQLKCLSEATFLDECRFVSNLRPTPIEKIYRQMDDEDEGVWSLDVDRLMCPYLPICDPIVNGLIVRWDHAHITTRFAAAIEPSVERLLDDNAILR